MISFMRHASRSVINNQAQQITMIKMSRRLLFTNLIHQLRTIIHIVD